MTQEIFSINSRLFKKAVSSVKKFKPVDLYMKGDGSEVYLYSFNVPHCDYIQYKLEDVKITSPFCFITDVEKIGDAIDGASGDIAFRQHTKTAIEIDANTKKSYIAVINTDVSPKYKFSEEEMYEIHADRVVDFGKCLSSQFISSWAIIEDFYYMHVDNISERVISPNMIFYKSTSKKELELSIPGAIIKNLNQKVDIDVLVDGATCRIRSGNLSVDFRTYYCDPKYDYKLSEEQSISLNTAKLLGAITAIGKASPDGDLNILYNTTANTVSFQSGNAIYKIDQPKGHIQSNCSIFTSCANFKKALEFLSNNESIKMKLFIEDNVIKGIELGYDDGDNLEYVVISVKR